MRDGRADRRTDGVKPIYPPPLQLHNDVLLYEDGCMQRLKIHIFVNVKKSFTKISCEMLHREGDCKYIIASRSGWYNLSYKRFHFEDMISVVNGPTPGTQLRKMDYCTICPMERQENMHIFQNDSESEKGAVLWYNCLFYEHNKWQTQFYLPSLFYGLVLCTYITEVPPALSSGLCDKQLSKNQGT